MTQPDPPENEKKSEPEADRLPEAKEFPQRHPRFGFYREKVKNQPAETGNGSASMIASQFNRRPSNKRAAFSSPFPKADPPGANLPVMARPTENQAAEPVQDIVPGNAASIRDENNPGRRLHAFEAAAKNAPPAKIPWKYRLRPTSEATHRAYWDVASAFSLIANLILIAVVVVMAFQIRKMETTANSLNSLGNDLLGGLYGNFVKMDQASINTTFSVNTQIPLNFNLPVSQNTTVVLTGNVAIPKAHIVINTGGVAINSVASVTLPAGTSLPVSLNLTIPVQATVPVSLQVPLNIPLNQTGLHQPVTGLQTTILPLYCMLNKNAQYPQGTFICAQQNAATSGTP